jgi:multidrug resistance efflux pump
MSRKTLYFATLGIFSLACLALLVFFAMRKPSLRDESANLEKDTPRGQIGGKTVQVIRPRERGATTINARQLCVLQPFFKAELSSRLSGTVRSVEKNIGDPIHAGEVLLVLEVPDLVADLKSKEEQVNLKKNEVVTAQALLSSKEAGLEAAKAKVDQAKASITQAIATREFRKKRLDRFQTLAKDDTVTADLVDEQTKEFEAAAAAVELAMAASGQANGALTEKKAEIVAAMAEVEQKKIAVSVAIREMEKAQAQLGLSKLTAPFDGIVVARSVDPGDFSFTPSGVSKTAMLVVASDKRSKVVARFPDSILVGLSSKTKAEITFDQLPGFVLSAPISRYAPMVDSTDRAVLVEVDLDLRPETAGTNWPGSLRVNKELASRLVLGMTGSMKIELENLGSAAVIPSGALISKGGKPHLVLVEGGFARLYPAVVQLDDGKVAVAQIPINLSKPGITRHLTPNDLVVLNRQAELQDGARVVPAEVKP